MGARLLVELRALRVDDDGRRTLARRRQRNRCECGIQPFDQQPLPAKNCVPELVTGGGVARATPRRAPAPRAARDPASAEAPSPPNFTRSTSRTMLSSATLALSSAHDRTYSPFV